MEHDSLEFDGRHSDFVLIGDPVAHSLSPAMHNALYEELAKVKWPFSKWRYTAVRCIDEEEARYQIDFVRTGRYRGMNITMPYKRLAFECADYADSSVIAAGGANVLVRDENLKLCAYNTDGLGAISAIERTMDASIGGMRVLVCGTGPTSLTIATAGAQKGAAEVMLASRSESRAQSRARQVQGCLDAAQARAVRGVSYDEAQGAAGEMDVIVDATPRGMNPGDEAIIDTACLHSGQVVLDTVYAHGDTALLAGARLQGATAMDGLEMLVEQAALSVEIWADAMALPIAADRDVMRRAALHRQK